MSLSLGRRDLLLVSAGAFASAAHAQPREVDWQALGRDVRAEMAWAWRNYRARAWGKDVIKPVSGVGEDYLVKGYGVGLSMVEALGTLWVMGLDAEFEDNVRWIKQNLRFDIDGWAQGFETNIRLTGGLLSGHAASGDERLLELAHDLGSRLLPLFDTPTGMPRRFVNLKTGATRDALSNPAEVGGGWAPEFGVLGRLTGEPKFLAAAKRAQVALYERRSRIDLVPDAIDVVTGQWKSRRATIGPPSDSYYEYLWDAWQLFGDHDFLDMYNVLTRACLAHMSETVDGRLWFANVDYETGVRLDQHQDELSAFYGGLLTQGGFVAQGRANALAWAYEQDRFVVLPEDTDIVTQTALAKTNALRPELPDSCLNIWLLHPDDIWRRIARTHFLNMKATSRAPYGYSGISNVLARPMTWDDFCPGYWWSEQMKYYYLLFSDTPRFDYRTNYLSTEGDVLQGFVRA